MYGGDDPNTARVRPVVYESETRQGVTFSRNYAPRALRPFCPPQRVTKSSSLGSRTESPSTGPGRSGLDSGQVSSISSLVGTVSTTMEAYDYDPLTLARTGESSFGRLVRTMKYRTDGTLEWVRQAGLATRQTNLGFSHRGIPTSITYPDLSATSATINDHGQVTSVTTERGYTTQYHYRGDGRLYEIRHPTPDTQAWNVTSIAFQPSGLEYGVAAGHWAQTLSTEPGSNARCSTRCGAPASPASHRRWGQSALLAEFRSRRARDLHLAPRRH